ncbi:P-loop containing nucleoside triphosphate hydrolase protein [Metschnikowia bicuspidata var. bicuspidata NRRL YB-4993]|uniref:ATP-dependent RNA helicase n=1 Tax=Metschnikowia bicuspidata var. bicuspidata NRRL YB-4993 TaxID=869754 RepID=A0A1A0HJZ5_9ASCO|nr:P-loop containing nucleoside triphosphate hydrolase protein [Metschnikowia bicuspidata var. bicuspidata NRRL YB-4993]OBA24207.1 P-loop containing nucleoside triphosphate hydrolase protein [Metschnikowia bicuspidata var. bicuspidata NRRL YB-4993]
MLVPARKGKRLDASPTTPGHKKKVFAFGNFASLHKPEKTHIEKSEGIIEKVVSFDALRVFPTVRAAMIKEIRQSYNFKNTYVASKEQLDIKPLPVQIAAIKKINQPRKVSAQKLEEVGNVLLHDIVKENESSKLKVFTIAAETGSGKTWAYLASVLLKLKEDDLRLFKHSPRSYAEAQSAQMVRAVILLPTHELVSQVYDTVRAACDMPLNAAADLPRRFLDSEEYGRFLQEPENASGLNLNVVKWGSGESPGKLFGQLETRRVDVLVTTPGKLEGLSKLTNFQRPFRFFSHVDYCVVDEADTLMDDSWFVDTTAVLLRFPRLKDLIMCSATIPRDFEKSIKRVFKEDKSIIRIVTPQIHKIPRQIAVKIIDAQQAPYHGSKTRCLAQALYAIHNDGTEAGFVKRIIVFVNEKKNVQPLVDVLIAKFGHRFQDVVGVTGRDSADERRLKIAPFLKQAVPLKDDPDKSEIKVLVTTDLMARGLNFQGIKNVVLMDLPKTSIDLIHRIGRTGRMRQSGRVFVIIDKKSGKSWIKGLPTAIKQGATIG